MFLQEKLAARRRERAFIDEGLRELLRREPEGHIFSLAMHGRGAMIRGELSMQLCELIASFTERHGYEPARVLLSDAVFDQLCLELELSIPRARLFLLGVEVKPALRLLDSLVVLF